MIGNFLLVDDEALGRLLGAPAGIRDLLARAVAQGDASGEHVDVHKAWHALHFLLTGTAWEGAPPLNFIVKGGTPIGEEDLGHGSARGLRAPEVQTLAAALAEITTETLREGYDGKTMVALEVYPGGWSDLAPTSEALEHVWEGFAEVKALVQKGAAQGMGLLIWMS